VEFGNFQKQRVLKGAVGIGNFVKRRGAMGEVSNVGKKRGATVEFGNYEKSGVNVEVDIVEKACHRGVW
jgi:hypothetical protein